MGHRVRFAEKVCIAVYNHSTGLTVITGLSLSPVQSRSWSSPWSSPSVAGTPVAVGCFCPVCVRRFYPGRMWHVGILWWSCCAGLLYSCSDEFLAVAGHSLATGRVDGARCSESALSWASRGFGGLLEIGRFPWIARRFATSELSWLSEKVRESPPVSIHAEASSNLSSRGRFAPGSSERSVSCRDGSSTRDLSATQTQQATWSPLRLRGRLLQYSYSARLVLACAPLRLWGRRRASSVCLSSASSALRPTGATVAPPSHHRDSLLREVALSAQDGIPRVSLRLRAPAEQSCSFPPSTTCPMLLSVCASVPSPTALRVYLGKVQFAYEFSEVKERETVFWDCGFAPPGFFPGVF